MYEIMLIYIEYLIRAVARAMNFAGIRYILHKVMFLEEITKTKILTPQQHFSQWSI